MISELKIAVNWICQIIDQNLKSSKSCLLPPEITEKRIDEFRMALFKAMFKAFAPEWNIHAPLDRQWKRAIRIHHEQNDSKNNCFEVAMAKCGLSYQTLALQELWFDLIINPGMVMHEQDGVYLYDKNAEQFNQKLSSDKDMDALGRELTLKYENLRKLSM